MTQKRSRRAGVEDRWHRSDGGRTARYSVGMRWRARYVDDQGREHAKSFKAKADAQAWLDRQTGSIETGTHVAPRDAHLTVALWCGTWLDAYKVNRASTVKQARVHINQIVAEFGDMPLSAVRPLQVRAWTAKLTEAGRKPSYIYALHSRLSQIMTDAVYDNRLGRNPCSRRTSPPMGKQKPYLLTTAQVWAIHEAVPDHLKVAVLLGAFAGLSIGEVSGLRVSDVDFARGIIHPRQQWAGAPLKTKARDAPIPVGELTLLLAASVQKYPADMMVTKGVGTDRCHPKNIEYAMTRVREKVDGLPEGFTFHDLRHYFGSMLIGKGADVKQVQARMRHASAKVTLDVYAGLWPDADDHTRSAIKSVLDESTALKTPADPLRTEKPSARHRRRSQS